MKKYTYKTRGFSIGCQPKDFEKVVQEEERFETLYYNRELTAQEINEYELIDLNEKPSKYVEKAQNEMIIDYMTWALDSLKNAINNDSKEEIKEAKELILKITKEFVE